jgi:hypothetical protein
MNLHVMEWFHRPTHRGKSTFQEPLRLETIRVRVDFFAPQRLPLTTFMSDKEPVWKALVKKHNLLEYTFHDAAAWPFGEAVFNLGYDVC